jgi:hypothetical protein
MAVYRESPCRLGTHQGRSSLPCYAAFAHDKIWIRESLMKNMNLIQSENLNIKKPLQNPRIYTGEEDNEHKGI